MAGIIEARPVGVYLGASDIARLHRLADRENLSRSEIVRRALIAVECDPYKLAGAQLSIDKDAYRAPERL